MSAQNTPYEAGLGRFVKLDKGDFVGRGALLRRKQEDVRRTLACLAIDGNEAIPHGWEPVLAGKRIIGHVTSAEYGHVAKTTLALAYLPVIYSEPGTRLKVRILGDSCRATAVPAPVYDTQATSS